MTQQTFVSSSCNLHTEGCFVHCTFSRTKGNWDFISAASQFTALVGKGLWGFLHKLMLWPSSDTCRSLHHSLTRIAPHLTTQGPEVSAFLCQVVVRRRRPGYQKAPLKVHIRQSVYSEIINMFASISFRCNIVKLVEWF